MCALQLHQLYQSHKLIGAVEWEGAGHEGIHIALVYPARTWSNSSTRSKVLSEYRGLLKNCTAWPQQKGFKYQKKVFGKGGMAIHCSYQKCTFDFKSADILK